MLGSSIFLIYGDWSEGAQTVRLTRTCVVHRVSQMQMFALQLT